MSGQSRMRPVGVRAPHGATTFEVDWADGATGRIPHALLRGYCPCASCQGHAGGIAYVDGGSLELTSIEQVGNYALQLGWADGHVTGIYTFAYLRQLTDLVATHGDDLPAVFDELPAP